MKYINKYNNFLINEEWSKNDPIPELSLSKNLGIILLGAPGIGKSTFIRDFISPRLKNSKTFSTDDVSLMFSKDPNVYHSGSSELNILRLKKFIETGQNFIYDTTGAQDKNIYEIFSLSRKFNYKLIFVHLVGPLSLSIKQNLERDRKVDPDYIKFVYDKQYQNMRSYSNSLNPDSYYIVTNMNGKYKFYKYDNSGILKRKVYKYVKENLSHDEIKNENSELLSYLIDNMVDFIDDDYNITFKSLSGDIKPRDILGKRKYDVDEIPPNKDNFMPIRKSGKYLKSKFSIVFHQLGNGYDKLSNLVDGMITTVNRLKDNGWNLYDLKIKTERSPNDIDVFSTSWIEYCFSKPDVKISDDFNIDSKLLKDEFEKNGLSITDIDEEEEDGSYQIKVDFESKSYDGRLYKDMDTIFDKICDIFGFDEYSWYNGDYHVYFYIYETPNLI